MSWNLNETLRHAFAGGILLIFIIVAFRDSPYRCLFAETEVAIAAGTGAVLLMGTLLYVLHRAFIYPLHLLGDDVSS